MIKQYYACWSSLQILEITTDPDSAKKKENVFDTYKEALEALIKMHDEELQDKLHAIEWIVLARQTYNMQLAKIVLDEAREKK